MGFLISIESLKIEDFGPFYGENKIDFTTKVGCPPHVLIGGKNGAGKTHILRALYLAVVGRVGVVDLKKVETGSDATQFNFDRVLNRRAELKGRDTCRLAITIVQTDADSGDKRKLTINRSIRFRANSSPHWSSFALRSDNDVPIEDDALIERLRDAFLPRHLARFFFFDAEKSQNVQLGEEDVVKGISRILGLWSYEQLEDDLRQLVQNTNKNLSQTGANDASAKLGKVSGRISEINGELSTIDHQRSQLVIEKQEAESKLESVEDSLKSLGAVDPNKLTANQERRQEVALAKNDIESQLRAAWETPLPVALLGALRHELNTQLGAEDKLRAWEDRKKAIEPKLPAVKKKVFDAPPPLHVLAEDTLSFYQERLDQAMKGLFHPPPDGIENVRIFVTERSDVNQAVRQVLRVAPAGLDGLADSCRKLELLEADVRDLDHSIRQQTQNIAAIGAGQAYHAERATLHASIAQNDQQLGDLQAKKIRFEQELVELRGEEDRWTKAEREASKGRSLASLASIYREAVGELRKRASDRLRKKINELVGALWTEITGRDMEFRGMQFDTMWNCFLVQHNGKLVSWDDINTSAGQRQVRLLAFYEALRRLAQTVPPLVVDTPLGRLDKEVRSAVLNRLYLSDDGHQSIVLSTNAEIDPEGQLFKDVRDQFGRGYTLEPIGNPESQDYAVQIVDNYFGKRL